MAYGRGHAVRRVGGSGRLGEPEMLHDHERNLILGSVSGAGHRTLYLTGCVLRHGNPVKRAGEEYYPSGVPKGQSGTNVFALEDIFHSHRVWTMALDKLEDRGEYLVDTGCQGSAGGGANGTASHQAERSRKLAADHAEAGYGGTRIDAEYDAFDRVGRRCGGAGAHRANLTAFNFRRRGTIPRTVSLSSA